MKTLLNKAQHDGSSWNAVCIVKGFTVSASYVDNKVGVYLVPSKCGSGPKPPKWLMGYVHQWATQQVAQLGEAWMHKHRLLYGDKEIGSCPECSASVTSVISCPDGSELSQACLDTGAH